jgi:hypothetical protein
LLAPDEYKAQLRKWIEAVLHEGYPVDAFQLDYMLTFEGDKPETDAFDNLREKDFFQSVLTVSRNARPSVSRDDKGEGLITYEEFEVWLRQATERYLGSTA